MDGWKDQPKEKMQEQIAMIRRGVMLLCYGVVAHELALILTAENMLLDIVIMSSCADAVSKIFMTM